jgi:hypothetical protein
VSLVCNFPQFYILLLSNSTFGKVKDKMMQNSRQGTGKVEAGIAQSI